MSKLLLHCGGERADFDDVELVETPEATDTHFPLPHADFIRGVRHHLEDGGYSITSQEHALTKDGQRYFGVISLGTTGRDGDYGWTIGLRNSHDKAYSAGIAAGSRVFVCDNLCFNGEVTVMRKHTRHIRDDLNQLMPRAIGQLGGMLTLNDNRYNQYKQRNLADREVNHLMIGALDAKIIPATRIPRVLENWREPKQEVWNEHRDVWGLFNAFTEDFKNISDANTLLKRGQSLHGLMDAFVGFNPSVN